MDLFNVIPDNFFSLLSSKNKRIYTTIILEAFKIYETGSIIGIEKKIVVDELQHILDNKDYQYQVEDEEDEEANVKNKRDLINYTLRKLEECGWIYIDVSNDYEEILNFTDSAITMCEALLELSPRYYDDSFDEQFTSNKEYQGYIYTIYSLLNNEVNDEYSFVIAQVIKNTKLLIRAIRKLDSRLKNYISSVFENNDIKDLMDNLVNYREDFINNGYQMLKMGDNINRYRLKIVTKLEYYQSNMDIMTNISTNFSTLGTAKALDKSNRIIDEMIDIFNSLDEYITQIDEKSKNYINSTIAKIKFLLSEDDNIIGKLNRLLKYIKDENKEDHIEKALKVVNECIKITTARPLNENSLYFPRGNYKRNFNLLLDDSRLGDFDLQGDFFDAYKAPYNEADVLVFINDNLVDNALYGSQIILRDTDINTSMLVIYTILYALENEEEFDLEILNQYIYNIHLKMKDFVIRKKVK